MIMNHNFIRLRNEEEEKDYNSSKRSDRLLLMISRPLIFLLLLIALAGPFTEEHITVPGNPSLKILADNSTSFDIFEQDIADDLVKNLNGRIPVDLNYIASGERSAIGDGILNSMEGDDNLLLITDGNNNEGRVLGDVILFASSLNTSISTIDIKPLKDDAGVIIKGQKEIITGQQSTFDVIVNTVGTPGNYNLKVSVDDKEVINKDNVIKDIISASFEDGWHEIRAELSIDDHFPQNNIYYKTVKAVPRPKVLFISQKASPMYDSLSDIYGVVSYEYLPEDLAPYHTIIINDIKGEQLKEWVTEISSYTADGNGLIIVGGKNAYDNGYYQYPDYMIEGLLPVRVGKAEKSPTSSVSIVVLIDISGTAGGSFSGSGGNSKLDVQKAIALSVINDIRKDDNLAVVAFNDVSHLVSPLNRLSDKTDLAEKIRRLKAGGGTLVFQGMRRAEYLLDAAQGSKHIIIISDGLDAAPEFAADLTRLLYTKGIHTFTVGIGEGTNEHFLRNLATKGGGIYFRPSEMQNMKLLFGEGEEGEELNLVILDNSHWITKGNITLHASISGFNYVYPKSGAKTILSTGDGNPILTVGRFGLGRVVALTTDDGSKWASQLLSPKNSKILTKTINWAIGDLGNKKDFDIDIDDTVTGEMTDIKVVSKETPKSEEFSFSKFSKDLYVARFAKDEPGIYNVLGAKVAVNYADEYKELGVNNELYGLVTLTKGSVFKKDDVDDIVEAVKSLSKRVKTKIISYAWPFTIIALLLLVIEIVMRKIKENKITKGD